MKQFIYMLFLFIGWGQVAQAQFADTLKTERLELRLEPGLVDFISFSPCGKEWFQAQRDAWKPELDEDMRNERAWENYYLACQGIWNGDTLLWKKEQPRLMKKMKSIFPVQGCIIKHWIIKSWFLIKKNGKPLNGRLFL